MTASAASNPFGLYNSLRIPVAAATLTAIRHHVGTFDQSDLYQTATVKHNVGAVRVHARVPSAIPQDAKLWNHPAAAAFFDVLYAREQLWVHVDFEGYGRAWEKLMSSVPSGIFLDHIQNRRSTWLRNSVYPYIRLCPVPRQINTNAGHGSGAEGMEFRYVQQLRASMSKRAWAKEMRDLQLREFSRGMVYADPLDLTKMLRISPGTKVLAGVGAFQHWFYDPY